MAAETSYRIEPCRLEQHSEELLDTIAAVVRSAAGLASRLHPRTAQSLAELVRVMNCYYSNLIEGHNTRPRDIERSLAEDWDKGERRNLQLEARAHIRVQTTVDARFAAGKLIDLTAAGLVASDSPKGPVSLRFNVASADALFPRLFGGSE